MDNINKVCYQAFGAILFCAGIFVLLYGAAQYNKALDTARNNYKDKENLYQQYNDSEDEIISKGELIATLYSGLEYDVEIDGLVIDKDVHNREFIDTYKIDKEAYKKSYLYDENGNIKMIIYTGMAG